MSENKDDKLTSAECQHMLILGQVKHYCILEDAHDGPHESKEGETWVPVLRQKFDVFMERIATRDREIDELQDENDGLRARIQELEQQYQRDGEQFERDGETLAQFGRTNAKLQAENEQLRKALTDAPHSQRCYVHSGWFPCNCYKKVLAEEAIKPVDGTKS